MDELKAWLIANNVPENIKQFLLSKSFPFGKKIGSVRFVSKESIIEENESELLPSFVGNGLLVIGTATDGDYWAINFKGDPPYVIVLPFDNMPSKGENVIPSTIMEKVSDSVSEFIKLANEDKLPLDYYEAKKRRENAQ